MTLSQLVTEDVIGGHVVLATEIRRRAAIGGLEGTRPLKFYSFFLRLMACLNVV